MTDNIKTRPIDTIPTADLIEELLVRCDPAIFIGHKEESDGPISYYQYLGSPSVCYGLCHQLAFIINSNEMKNNLKIEE